MNKNFKSVLKIVIFYFIFSTLWILASDILIQSIKGVLFVVVSALIFFILTFRELNKREKVEKILGRERNVLNELLNVANDIVVILDEEGKIEYINEKGCNFLGYQREEIIGKDWFENFIPTKERERVREVFQKIKKEEFENNTSVYKNPVVTKNNEIRIILWNNTIIKNKKIKVLSFGTDITEEEINKEGTKLLNIVIEDITKADNIEIAIRKTLNRICDFFDSPYGEFWILNEEGKKLVSSGIYYTLDDFYENFYLESQKYSFSPGEGIPGKTWVCLLPIIIDDLEKEEAFLRKDFVKKFNLNSLVSIPICSENEFIGVLMIFKEKLNNLDKKKVEFLSVVSSQLGLIIERKKYFDKAEELVNLIDMSNDAIVIIDKNGTVLFWNNGAEKIYGIPREDILGRKFDRFLSLIYDDINLFYKIQDELMSKGFWFGEIPQKRKNGEKIIVESQRFVIKDDKGDISKIYIRNTDITNYKRMQEQLYRAQKLESIGILAGGIAHDLNNILSPIIMGLSILREKLKDDKELKNTIDIMQNSAERGANLVKQILSFVRGEKKEKAPIQLRYILKDLEKLLKETFPKNIQIEISVQKDLWMIYGDPTAINQVLVNLCVNARDAMEEGGILTIKAENIFIDDDYTQFNPLSKVGNYVLITVADTGKGIPKEIMDKIFDPFFTTKGEKGTGLGLAIVYSIVKEHHGFINVYSEPYKGTVFKIYLPAVETSLDVEETKSQENLKGKGEGILIVDDEDNIRELVKNILVRNNYIVFLAENGEKALEVFKENKDKISIAIIDFSLPDMNGKIIREKLLEISPNLKIIIISGIVENGILKDVPIFLRKPFTVDELLKLIKTI